MSNETILPTIEIVKKKLKKYTALKEHGKVITILYLKFHLIEYFFQVKEYLRKLNHTSLSPTLIQVRI